MKLHQILRIKEEQLRSLQKEMDEITNKSGIIQKLEEDLNSLLENRLSQMGLNTVSSSEEVVNGLTQQIAQNEKKLCEYLCFTPNNLNFQKIIDLIFKITPENRGFFLKKEKAREILEKNPPQKVLNYLGYKTVSEMLDKEDAVEIFSSLRFIETDEWMHKVFDSTYGSFTADDFEHRPIELKVLSEQWQEIGRKFAAKKYHNVSHLKEFGVVFLNPINQSSSGALLRDFALFAHYFHEIIFYSKLFELYCQNENFAFKLQALLRGDIPERTSVEKGEWLIISRYIWKNNPGDPRLFLPRINPESLHWRKGERDLVNFGKKNPESGFHFWENLDWVAGYFKNKNGEEKLVSFDLEDNAMIFSAKQRGENHEMWYHQQEAIWLEIFVRYIGEENMEKLLIQNFDKGIIKLQVL